MFDSWHPSVVRLRDEPVRIDFHKLWPGLDSSGFAPLEVRRRGLKLDALHPGRLVAWVRQSHGGWLAVVKTEARSADGSAVVPMTLWTPASAVRRETSM